MAPPRIDLEKELDRLYSAPLGEFVGARKALTARLTAAGDKDSAASVAALKKPSAPAWAVNQIRFEAPKILEAMLAAGDRLRGRPADVREAMQARRDALAAARKKVEEILATSGHAATPQTMRRVSSTLEALATYGHARGSPVAGRLSEELSPPGFEDLAALGVLPGTAAGPRLRAVPPLAPIKPSQPKKPAKPQSEAARAALDAQQERERARRARDAKEALSARKRDVAAARRSVDTAEKKVEAARLERQKLDTARDAAASAERRNEEALFTARRALQSAERAERDADAKAREAAERA